MPATALAVVLLAVTALVAVAGALCRAILVLRVRPRRDLECYLQWLLRHATGPVGVSRPLRYF